MNKYTEADYLSTHKGIVDDIIDSLISDWHNPQTDPLRARVCRNLASTLEELRDETGNVNVWVSAANLEKEQKPHEATPR